MEGRRSGKSSFKLRGSYVDEAVVEEEADDGGGQSGVASDGRSHGVLDDALEVRTGSGVEVGAELGACRAQAQKEDEENGRQRRTTHASHRRRTKKACRISLLLSTLRL